VKTHGHIRDGGRRPNCRCMYLNHYNSAEDCSISLKFGTEFDHITADTLQQGPYSMDLALQTFRVKGSKVNVTA